MKAEIEKLILMMDGANVKHFIVSHMRHSPRAPADKQAPEGNAAPAAQGCWGSFGALGFDAI